MKKTDEIKEYWRNNPTEESKKVAEKIYGVKK